jgi:peptide/nickel transport system substrate-binding protein
LTDLVLGIVPQHICGPAGGRFPEGEYIGTGPYAYLARYGERRLDLVAREGSTARIQHLIFRTIRDEGTRLLALLGGSADLMQNGLSPVLTTVLEEDPRLNVTYGPSIAFSYVALNLRDSALAHRKVRQALALAVPRQRIIDVHLGGHATPATGMLAPLNWAYEAEATAWPYQPDRARALLQEAGYGPDGKTLKITIKISTHRLRRTVARSIAQAWQDIGVNADVRAFEFGTFYADIKRGDFQAYLLDVPEPMEPDMYSWLLHGLGTPKKDPSPGDSPYASADRRFLSPGALDAHVADDPVCAPWRFGAVSDATANWIWRAWGADPPYYTANRMFYANPLVDCRIDLGQRTMGREGRRPLYREIQRILAEDLPVIPLWHPDVRVTSSKRVKGFEPLPNLRLANLVDAELTQ